MIRGSLFLFFGIGFLWLLAYSWGEQHQKIPSFGSRELASSSPAQLQSSNLPKAALSPEESKAEIRRLEACYQTENCDFPKSDPRSYRFALSESMAIVIAEHQINFGPDEEIAREGVIHPEPIVQVAAMKMLSALPPSSKNLSALANGLRNRPDPTLLTDGLKELERYMGSSLEIEAQKIVESLVAKETDLLPRGESNLLLPFINEHSHEEFRELFRQLDPAGQSRQLLKSALEIYESSVKNL